MIKRTLTLIFTICLAVSAQAEEMSVKDALTPFSIDYRSEYKVGWFSFDIDATRSLRKVDASHWRMAFDAEASIATLKESSDFILVGEQIIPVNYKYRSTGLIDEDDRTLHFVSDQKVVEDSESKKTISDQWQDGIQDNLTFMLQASIELARGKTEFEFPVFEKKKSKTFKFKVIGEETVKTPAGSFQAIKVQQVRSSKKREIYAWFGKSEGYPLLKLRDKKDGKLRYQIQATKINL